MADHTPDGSSRNVRREEPSEGQRIASSATNAGSNRRAGSRTPIHGARHQESRSSLRDPSATSRREFDFGTDDDHEISTVALDTSDALEPAPIIHEGSERSSDGEESSDGAMSERDARNLLLALDDSADYYAILGLPREPPPTTGRIRASYHRLSLAFHPDRHPHGRRAAAERYFTRLQRAYETLIEPKKRIIYDLQGEYAVSEEYRPGGALATSSETAIGVKTMSPEEFRKYYLDILRGRERKALTTLVESKGSCTLSLSAQHFFNGTFRKPDVHVVGGQSVSIPFRPLFATGLHLNHSCEVPLPSLGYALQKIIYEPVQSSEDLEPVSGAAAKLLTMPKLTLSGGIGGELDSKADIYLTDEPTPYVRMRTSLETENLNLAAGMEYAVPSIRDAGVLQTVFSDAVVVSTFAFLPRRVATIGLGKSFSIFENTTPINYFFRTSFDDDLIARPPTFDLRCTRKVAQNHIGHLQISTGHWVWPELLKKYLPLWQGPAGVFASVMPQVHLGWVRTSQRHLDIDDDSEAETSADDSSNEGPSSRNSAWSFEAIALPHDVNLNASYSFDLFGMPELSARSQFMTNGEPFKASPKELLTPRGIRIRATGTIGLSASMSLAVKGTRRVGEFTSVGMGVELTEHLGLAFIVSWRRLGQKIEIPVVLMPLEATSTSSWFLAVAIPFLTYTAIDFVLLRPRARRDQERLVQDRKKQLTARIEERRLGADEAVTLMRPMVEQKQAQASEDGGLVIIKASWGATADPPRHAKFHSGQTADVTIALAAMVDDSQLYIPRTLKKSHLTGFWDPAPLVQKSLRVEYLFEHRRHFVEVKGSAALRLPMRAHEV